MSIEKENIININKHRQKAEVQTLGNLLPTVLGTFAKDIKPKVIGYFESLDDTLFDLAEKAESNQKQTIYFEAMRGIRKSRKSMFKEFLAAIQNCFKLFKKNDYTYFNADSSYNKEVKSLSLSLINENELDESLAKTNLINKGEMAFHENIFALQKRFSVLASGTSLKTSHIPIGPYVIVNAFNQSIKSLDTDATVKLIMYKIFERNVMSHLDNIYTHTNELLASKGIVPEISYSFGRNQNQSQGTPNNTHQAQTVENTNNNIPEKSTNSTTIQDDNYQLISQLFKHNNQVDHNTQPSTNQNITSKTNVDMGSILNALSILQSDIFRNIKTDNSTQSPTEIKNILIKQLQEIDTEAKNKHVNQKDEDTIDLVGMLFQFIVDDRNLPETIQVLLVKLQIPYLKIALQDRNLFADKNHPARALLDKLSLASVGWNKESDFKGKFINALEDIVNQVLNIDDYKEDEFVVLHSDFDAFLIKLKKKSDVAQRRTEEKTLGQEKIYRAKKETAQLLVDKMTNTQMPILIRDILLGEWSNVLILMYLRHSQGSEEYQEKVDFVSDIIKISQLSDTQEINEEHIKNISFSYEKGLKLVAFNPKELIDKAHNLVKCLNKIHNLDPDNFTISDEVELIEPKEILKISEMRKQEHEITEFIEEIIEPTIVEENHQEIDDEFSNIVENLKSGTWLEFSRDDKTSVRAKLSWISPITGKYLFVNSRGLKVTNKSVLALATGLRNKSISILQQVALFDRALSAIATKLKKD